MMPDLHRRLLIAAIAALPARSLFAAEVSSRKLFADTALADNPIARKFTLEDIALPDVAVSTGNRTVLFSHLKRRTQIVSLWAEWCVPCLIEARDLAELRKRFADNNFDIGSVLTGSDKKLDFAAARTKLNAVGAEKLPLVVEPKGGAAILKTLSPGDNGLGDLPCTLIIDKAGRIRGRSNGVQMVQSASYDHFKIKPGEYARVLTESDKAAMAKSGVRTQWSTEAGSALVQALKDGILNN